MILSYLQLLLRIAGIEAELLISLEQQPPSQTPNLSCSQKPFLIMTRIIKMKNGNQDEENAEPNTTKRELKKKNSGWIIRQKLFSLYCYSLF